MQVCVVNDEDATRSEQLDGAQCTLSAIDAIHEHVVKRSWRKVRCTFDVLCGASVQMFAFMRRQQAIVHVV